MKRNILFLLILFLSLLPSSLAYSDETTLPEGSVQGLPSGLAAIDETGNPINSNSGNFFFYVEDMQPYTQYTKKISLLNIQTDYTYHLYFKVGDIINEGNINLAEECACEFYLDDELIYSGNIGGDGDINLTKSYDLGTFNPGDSRTLTCKITWNPEWEEIDYGAKLYSLEGETILREGNVTEEHSGKATFTWAFYAIRPDVASDTGILDFSSEFSAVLIAIMVVCCIVLLLCTKRRKKLLETSNKAIL